MSNLDQVKMKRGVTGSSSRFVNRIAFHLKHACSQGLLGEQQNPGRFQKRTADDEACFRAIAWKILSW